MKDFIFALLVILLVMASAMLIITISIHVYDAVVFTELGVTIIGSLIGLYKLYNN